MKKLVNYKNEIINEKWGMKKDINEENKKKGEKLDYLKINEGCKVKFIFLKYPFSSPLMFNGLERYGAILLTYNMYKKGFLFDPEMWNKEFIFRKKIFEIKNFLNENRNMKKEKGELWKMMWNLYYSVANITKVMFYGLIYVIEEKCENKENLQNMNNKIKILILSETMIDELLEIMEENDLSVEDINNGNEALVFSIKKINGKRKIFLLNNKVKTPNITVDTKWDILNLYSAPSEQEQMRFLISYVREYKEKMQPEWADEILRLLNIDEKKYLISDRKESNSLNDEKENPNNKKDNLIGSNEIFDVADSEVVFDDDDVKDFFETDDEIPF